MANVFVNDLASNPWIIAETGLVSTKNVKIAQIKHEEPDEPNHVAEVVDRHGRIVSRFSADRRTNEHVGWVHGLSIDQLDSGYLLVYFAA